MEEQSYNIAQALAFTAGLSLPPDRLSGLSAALPHILVAMRSLSGLDLAEYEPASRFRPPARQ